MLLAEVAPMSSTHSASCEFSSREISPMPLDRRVIFRGTAGPAVVFEELRKNFITLSETDAINPCARHYLRRREPCRFSGLFLNINLAFQEGALFNGDALCGHVTVYHCRFSQLHPIRGIHRPIQLTLDHHRLGGYVGLDVSVRTDCQAVVAELNLPFDAAIHVQVFGARHLSLDYDRLADVGKLSGLRSIHALASISSRSVRREYPIVNHPPLAARSSIRKSFSIRSLQQQPEPQLGPRATCGLLPCLNGVNVLGPFIA